MKLLSSIALATLLFTSCTVTENTEETITYDEPELPQEETIWDKMGVRFDLPEGWSEPSEENWKENASLADSYLLEEMAIDQANWTLNFGPVLEAPCTELVCYGYQLSSVEPIEADQVLTTIDANPAMSMVWDKEDRGIQMIRFTEPDICEDKRTLIFLEDQTLLFHADCSMNDSDYDTVLYSIDLFDYGI